MPAMATLTWSDLPGPPTRWLGLPALMALRRDDLGGIARQQGHGDLVRQIMVEHAGALVRWQRGPEVFAELMGQSVLVTEGEVWQRQRRMLMQAFTPRRVAGYAALMTEAAGLRAG